MAMNEIIEWLKLNWLGVFFLLLVVVLYIADKIKKRKQSEEERKRIELENSMREVEVTYHGDNKEFVTMNVQNVEPGEFIRVLMKLEAEGYTSEDKLNNFYPTDTIYFMRKSR